MNKKDEAPKTAHKPEKHDAKSGAKPGAKQGAKKEELKQSGIHPEIFNVTVRCACGSAFETISTMPRLEVDICSNCHPMFTGQQKFVDTAGRIEKFQQRYDKKKK